MVRLKFDWKYQSPRVDLKARHRKRFSAFTSLKALFANGWDWICKIPKKFFLKINHNISTFYIISITFYHFSNKKITTKQKISLFYTKHSYFFLHINQIWYSTSPIHSQTQPKRHCNSLGCWKEVLKYTYFSINELKSKK